MPLPTEPAADAEKAELSPRQMFAYALPALPVAFLYLPLPLLIPSFYSQQFGLSLTAIGSSARACRTHPPRSRRDRRPRRPRSR